MEKKFKVVGGEGVRVRDKKIQTVRNILIWRKIQKGAKVIDRDENPQKGQTERH